MEYKKFHKLFLPAVDLQPFKLVHPFSFNLTNVFCFFCGAGVFLDGDGLFYVAGVMMTGIRLILSYSLPYIIVDSSVVVV